MKDIITAIGVSLLIVAIVACFYRCRNEARRTDDQNVTVDTVYVIKTDTVLFFKPVPVSVSLPVIPPTVDTAAIINDYYAKKIYSELLIDTEYLKVSISDTIFKNAISYRNLSYELTLPEITKTVTFTKKPVFSLSLLLDTRPAASAIVGYKSFFLSGGYDFERKNTFAGLGVKILER
jgi:hypothetical protein